MYKAAPARLAAGLLILVAVAACSGKSSKLSDISPAPTSTVVPPPASTTSTTNPDPLVQLPLFFVRGSTLAVSIRGEHTRTARYQAVKDLFAGPDAAEAQAGLTSLIPPGVKVKGLTDVNGVMYLNTNGAFLLAAPSNAAAALRVAQIVYTLTSSPAINSVQFLVAGSRLASFDGVNLSNPVTRAAMAATVGPLLLQTPAVGATLTNPVTFSGLSQFSGAFEVQIYGPQGNILASSTQTTAPGASFEFTVPLSQPAAGTDTVKVLIAPHGGALQQLITLSLPYQPA